MNQGPHPFQAPADHRRIASWVRWVGVVMLVLLILHDVVSVLVVTDGLDLTLPVREQIALTSTAQLLPLTLRELAAFFAYAVMVMATNLMSRQNNMGTQFGLKCISVASFITIVSVFLVPRSWSLMSGGTFNVNAILAYAVMVLFIVGFLVLGIASFNDNRVPLAIGAILASFLMLYACGVELGMVNASMGVWTRVGIFVPAVMILWIGLIAARVPLENPHTT